MRIEDSGKRIFYNSSLKVSLGTGIYRFKMNPQEKERSDLLEKNKKFLISFLQQIAKKNSLKIETRVNPSSFVDYDSKSLSYTFVAMLPIETPLGKVSSFEKDIDKYAMRSDIKTSKLNTLGKNLDIKMIINRNQLTSVDYENIYKSLISVDKFNL